MQNHLSLSKRLLLSGSLAVAAGCSTPPALQVSDAYIKQPVPGKQMTAAYATFTNHTSEPICLTEFSGAFASNIELHTTETVSRAAGSDRSHKVRDRSHKVHDRVRMLHLPELCIQPAAAAILAPGGKHLMVMGVQDLSTSPIDIEIRSATGLTFAAPFEVQPFDYLR